MESFQIDTLTEAEGYPERVQAPNFSSGQEYVLFQVLFLNM